MRTPAFVLAREVIVAIEAPHVRSPEVDFYVLGDDFKFSVHP